MKNKSEKKWTEKFSHTKEELFFPEDKSRERSDFEFIPASILHTGYDAEHEFLLLVEVKYKGEEGQKYYYGAIYECRYFHSSIQYVEVILKNESWIKRPKYFR